MFTELSSSRDFSENGYPKPIPISEIRSYCEMFYIKGLDERATLTRMIQEMDRTFIEVRNEQIKTRLEENAKNH